MPPPRRAGATSLLLILVFLVMMIVFAWVFNLGVVWTTIAETRRTADAAALGATLELVDDAHLRGYLYDDASGMAALLGQSRTTAKNLCLLNLVNGKPFLLDDNLTNDPNGDIVFGFVDFPGAPFQVTDVNNDDALIATNAVKTRVLLLTERGTELKLFLAGLTATCGQDLGATATAMMDRDVIGFQNVYDNPISLAPLAFLADYTKNDKDSWNWQIEDSSNVDDSYSFNPVTKTFTPGSDGIGEFEAFVEYKKGGGTPSNVAFTFIGIGDGDYSALNGQLLTGITKTQMTNFGAPFQLAPATNTLTVPGSTDGPTTIADKDTLFNNLDQLRKDAAVRIWPLYCGFSGGDPVLCGFVAGRVVLVEKDKGKSKGKCKPPGKCQKSGDDLRFLVQPTMIATSAAITNVAQRGVNGIPILNPYISRVRLVE